MTNFVRLLPKFVPLIGNLFRSTGHQVCTSHILVTLRSASMHFPVIIPTEKVDVGTRSKLQSFVKGITYHGRFGELFQQHIANRSYILLRVHRTQGIFLAFAAGSVSCWSSRMLHRVPVPMNKNENGK